VGAGKPERASTAAKIDMQSTNGKGTKFTLKGFPLTLIISPALFCCAAGTDEFRAAIGSRRKKIRPPARR